MGDLFLFAELVSDNHAWVYISHVVLIALIALVLAKMATADMKLVPSGVQNVLEAYLGFVVKIGTDTLGSEKKAKRYLPLVATLGFRVLFANARGIIPGFESPSAYLDYTLSLALIVFIYYTYEGIKRNGFIHYIAHFAGPSKMLATIMFPVEILSHCSRVVSLSFRLFGSIRGDDMFLIILLFLAPWVAPLAGFTLLTIMGALQTFVFMMLTYVYISGAVLIAEEHH